MASTAVEINPPSNLSWRHWSRSSGPAILGVAAAFAPLLILHFQQLWSLPRYRFFPLVLAAAALLMWRRWPRNSRRPLVVPHRAMKTCLGVSLTLLAAAVLLFSPWLAAAGAVFFTAAMLMYCVGRAFWSKLFSVWLLLWLLTPPPFGLDLQLIQGLQNVTSRQASLILDLFGVAHVLTGNVIDLPSHRLFVEEACSGVRSLFALVAFAALFVVWTRRPVVAALVLIASAVFWAGLCNVVRVTVVALALDRWGIDLSTGWRHELLGAAMFSAALIMVLSTDRFLKLAWPLYGLVLSLVVRGISRLRGGLTADEDDEIVSRRAEPEQQLTTDQQLAPDRDSAPRRWLAAGGVFASLAVIQVVALVLAGKGQAEVGGFQLSKSAVNLSKSSLPDEHSGWKMVDYRLEQRDLRSEFGQYSKQWTYQSAFCPAVVSFDYPFEGWHPLTQCYRSLGWNVVSRSVHTGKLAVSAASDQGGAGLHPPLVEVEMIKPTGEQGYLLFSIFDESGRAVQPPALSVSALPESVLSRLHSKILRSPVLQLLVGKKLATGGSTYQLQTFVTTDFRLQVDERRQVRTHFLKVSGLFNDWRQEEAGDQP